MGRGRSKLLAAGARAPEFELDRLDGSPVSLRELLAEGPVLLAFFKISCPVCQFTFPYLDRLHRSGAIRVIGISQNDAQGTRDFNRAFGVSFPTLLDAEERDFAVSNAYGISHVPTCYRIEADGSIGQVVEGWQKREMVALAARNGSTIIRESEYVPEWKAG